MPVAFSGVLTEKHIQYGEPSYQVERYWIVFGLLGNTTFKSLKPGSFVTRRFLMARDSHGFTRYFYWTHPNRGDLAVRVFGVRKIKAISREKALQHFRKIR